MNSKLMNIVRGFGIVTLSAIAVVLAVAGCNKTDKAEASVEGNFKVDYNSKIDGIYATEVIDKDTGVYYLILRNNGDVAITPLYNADDTLKVEGGNENE